MGFIYQEANAYGVEALVALERHYTPTEEKYCTAGTVKRSFLEISDKSSSPLYSTDGWLLTISIYQAPHHLSI